MERKVIRKVFIWIVAIAVLMLLPTSLGMQHQSTEKALILGFGVDKNESEYEVSMQVLIPQYNQSFAEKVEIVSEKGKTIDLALGNTRLKIGKELAVAHANIIVLNSAVLEDNIMRVLDYFYRDRYLGNYSIVLSTDDNAKEILQATSEMDSASLNSLDNIVKYNDKNVLGQQTNLHTIATGYYSPARTCIIPHIDLEKSSGQDGGSSGGESGGSSSGGGGGGSSGGSGGNGEPSEQGSTKLKNEGAVVIIKDGKFQTKLARKDFRGFSWLMNNSKGYILELNNVSDDIYKDATVVVEIVKSNTKLNYGFSNLNKPIIKVEIGLTYKISSATQSEYDSKKYADFVPQDTEALETAIKTLVKTEIQNALQIAKDGHFDVWNVYDKLHQFHTKKLKKYLAETEGDYMRDLEIFTTVHTAEARL